MKKLFLTVCFVCVLISFGGAVQGAMVDIPIDQSSWNYSSVANPVMQSNPADCKPFAVGDLSSGNLDLQVGFLAFSSGVDIYLAIQSNVIANGALLLIDQDKNLVPVSAVLPKWKTNNTTAIDESLYGNIPVSVLPVGKYNFYVLVVPTGETDFSHYYFWSTSWQHESDSATNPNDVDDDKDGFTENQGDCNDNDASINPSAIEICGDGIDQTCNNIDAPCDGGIVKEECEDGKCWLDISGEAQGQDRILESLNLGKSCTCMNLGSSYSWWCEYQGETGYIEGFAPGVCPSYDNPLYSN